MPDQPTDFSLAECRAQLDAANRELESFAYAVSHDLRAPLRALHGNAEILIEDYGEQLDEGARKALDRIQWNARRMDRLINDLLTFFRMGSKALRKSPLDMEEQVRTIIAERTQDAKPVPDVKVGPLPEGFGDPALIQQVWRALISNAIKYTSRTEHPFIEVGGREKETEMEYYIRDNGAGFDMHYAGKLFGMFQRLHDESEFEGNGTGLAIAHRIIMKHGGRIRGEAVPGNGATFFFTLPRPEDKP